MPKGSAHTLLIPICMDYIIEECNISHQVQAVLDHFFLNEITQRAVLDAGVIHLPDNQSDHCPIFLHSNQ